MSITMFRNLFFIAAVLFVMVAAPAPSPAQDRLEPIAKKPKLDSRDRATIAAEVAARSGKLAQAGTDAEARIRARDHLIATADLPGASKEFLKAYVEACAKELEPLTTSESFEAGFDAVAILVALDNRKTAANSKTLDSPKTAEALATALKSSHRPTRLRAARGLQLVQERIAGDEKTGQVVLRALGEAGAAEREDNILRVTYQALDFGPALKNGKLAEDCAKALNAILAGRIRRLKEGNRNETLDEPAVALAGRCFGGASEAQQKQLVTNLTILLSHAVDRYFAADTAEGYLPSLSYMIEKIESSIRSMMKASNVKPPNSTVAGVVAKSKGSKDESAARTALGELKTALSGEPWKLKFEP